MLLLPDDLSCCMMADGRVVERENLEKILDAIWKIKKKKEGQFEEKNNTGMYGRV